MSSRALVQAAGLRLAGGVEPKVWSLKGCLTRVTGAWAGSQMGYRCLCVCVCVVLGRVAVGAEKQRESGPVQGQNPQGPFVCFQQTFTVGRSSSSEGP